MTTGIEYKWDEIGALLANQDDESQGKFFKGFAHELNNFDTHYQAQMQMAYVNSKLSDKDKAILEDILPNIWYKEGDK